MELFPVQLFLAEAATVQDQDQFNWVFLSKLSTITKPDVPQLQTRLRQTHSLCSVCGRNKESIQGYIQLSSQPQIFQQLLALSISFLICFFIPKFLPSVCFIDAIFVGGQRISTMILLMLLQFMVLFIKIYLYCFVFSFPFQEGCPLFLLSRPKPLQKFQIMPLAYVCPSSFPIT